MRTTLQALAAVLGGTQYFNDPPEVMFHHQGRIIKVGSRHGSLRNRSLRHTAMMSVRDSLIETDVGSGIVQG